MNETYRTMAELGAAVDHCTRCPLYRDATQGVAGEGPARPKAMLIGEQPGDREDLLGRPFVGPAGRILDAALQEAGIERKKIYLTNAVKHFKFEQRGKKRLHKRPNAYEIERCNWWLFHERTLLKPSLIVALGATAWRAVAGKVSTIAAARGRVGALDDGTALIVTIHPSFLLRIREQPAYAAEMKKFVSDLSLARPFLAAARKSKRPAHIADSARSSAVSAARSRT